MTDDDANLFDQELVDALRAHYPGREIRVSLTDAGRAVGNRLGTAWFGSALAALGLAHDGSALEVVMASSGQEPLPAPTPIQPALAGAMFGQGEAIGRISVKGTEPRCDAVHRVLRVPSEALLDERGEFHFVAPTSLKRRVVGSAYTRVYSHTPVLLDRWRQSRNTRGNVTERLVRTHASPMTTVTTADEAPGARPVAWFALHWLESGGAESWALESAQLAADAGYQVVITADVPAPQRLLDRALAITDDVYIPSNSISEEDWGPFLSNLVKRHRPSVVHVHHSSRAYAFLPELRHGYPGVTVIDSTHIVEHRTGGFVRQSLEMSPFVDVHHVISPELRDLYLLDARIDRAKVAYRPLTGLEAVASVEKARADGPLRIGFLGRVAPQKRPFLFVELARRLHRRYPGRFEFVMQGSGGLSALTDAQIQRDGLGDVISRRPWGPITEFMDAVDVLVISSDNEGLTLTSLEAEEHGVLVLSSDVGSQRTVIAPELLVPRNPNGFLKEAVTALVSLATSKAMFDAARAHQSELINALREVEPASTFLSTKLQQLKEKN
ncbi:glycosyltransferase [Oerskovia turbata]